MRVALCRASLGWWGMGLLNALVDRYQRPLTRIPCGGRLVSEPLWPKESA